MKCPNCNSQLEYETFYEEYNPDKYPYAIYFCKNCGWEGMWVKGKRGLARRLC